MTQGDSVSQKSRSHVVTESHTPELCAAYRQPHNPTVSPPPHHDSVTQSPPQHFFTPLCWEGTFKTLPSYCIFQTWPFLKPPWSEGFHLYSVAVSQVTFPEEESTLQCSCVLLPFERTFVKLNFWAKLWGMCRSKEKNILGWGPKQTPRMEVLKYPATKWWKETVKMESERKLYFR